MQIIVLGHKGMLGNVVHRFFEENGHEVITTNLKFEEPNHQEWTNFIQEYPKAVIINCIGKIKQKASDTRDLVWGNAILPLQLRNIMPDKNFLIHPSTDCVYSGTSNVSYPVDSLSDADDAYGWSKRLGEVALKGNNRALIIRVSIIGMEVSTKKSGLLEWFLSQPAKSDLKGYSNHFWNGITTLEWCKQVENFLNSKEQFGGKIIQLGTKHIFSKHDMLLLFQKVFNTGHVIQSVVTPSKVNRSLLPNIYCKPLEEQLIDLKNYYKFT